MNYKKYLPLAITLITVFLIIKGIDNYSIIHTTINDFIKTIMPFVSGVILAYALNPIVKFFEKKIKVSRGISILLTLLLLVAVISIAMLFIVPILVDNIIELGAQIPIYSKQIELFFYDNLEQIDNITDINITSFITTQIKNLVPTILELGKNIFSHILTTTVSITNLIINTVVSIVICIYTLIDKEKFIAYFKRLNKIILKDKEYVTINFIKIFNDIFGKYIIGIGTSSLFVGTITTIFLILIGANYAVLMGVLIGLTNMIPFFGPFIGGIPTVIINLFYSPKLAIMIAIFIIVLQQIDGNIISPKIVGNKVGINPFLTILSVTVGGHYFGVLGMVLAIPFVGVFKIYLDKLIDSKELRYNKIKAN